MCGYASRAVGQLQLAHAGRIRQPPAICEVMHFAQVIVSRPALVTAGLQLGSTIPIPSTWMEEIIVAAGRDVRVQADSEKITINLGFVDLGRIDLLVRDGFYSNRTDFIRTAIRNQLECHADAASKSVTRKQLELGLSHYSRTDLEALRSANQMLDIRVLGLATIADDVTAELARATIRSVVVLGALRASPAVKAALADRMS